ncbi:unnamed protein product [Schistosoma curassoni]|uniref:Uncharacterized protein n=1 Tax=Schistosoma curassoni TaxID=6186 RepID=A0A183JKC3_9TREM|nr:unnamed protein product [Schistosoma curassoni]
MVVLKISENNRAQTEQKILDSGEMLFHSGNQGGNASDTQEFAMVPSKEARRVLFSWIQNHQGILKNIEERDHNDCYPVKYAYQ